MQPTSTGNSNEGNPETHAPSPTVASSVPLSLAGATTPALSGVEQQNSGGVSDSNGVHRESMTEVGCLLGSFRDVAHSIGLNVTAVRLTTRPPGQSVWNTRPLSDRPQPRPNEVVDPSTPPSRVKFLPLVHVFCDSMLSAGYVVTHIDTVDCPPAVHGVSKQWKMEVCITQPPPAS